MLKSILRQSSALFVLAMALSGCSSLSGYPEPVVDPTKELSQLTVYFDHPTVNTNADAPVVPEATKRATRDQIITGRVRALDISFQEFEKSISTENGTFSVGTEWAQLVVGGLGTALGGAETKTALAAASTALAGAKPAVDKEVFYSNAMPAIIAAMDARRATILVTIKTGMTKSTDEYPLTLAILDIDDYERAGSIPGAINNILQSAGAEKDAADKDETLLRDDQFVKNLQPTVAIGTRVKALTDSQAVALANAMKPNLASRPQKTQANVNEIESVFPDWLTDGPSAKHVLQAWSQIDSRDSVSQSQWTSALDALPKPSAKKSKKPKKPS